MVFEVEIIPQVDALVTVRLVVQCKCRENPQLDAGGVTVFLDRSDDFHGAANLLVPIVGLDDLSKCTLAKLFDNGV